MKHLILAAAVAAFSIQAAEPAELPVQATPKLSFVNNRSLPGRRKSSVRKSSCARR